MKILYGVTGEGMGHAMRSRVVLEHLVKQGHDIKIMSSGRAADFLAKRFEGVNRIHGMHIVYDENRVRPGKTLWSNIAKSTVGVPQNISAYFELIQQFAPEMVISDFESWTHMYAMAHALPIVSVDNMQVINRCKHKKKIIGEERAWFEFTKAFVRTKLPWCDHYIITTFFYPDVRKKRTTLVPSILRPEILEKKTKKGEHLLVYQTGEGFDDLAGTLQQSGIECRVYGMRRDIKEEQVEGNIRYRPFSEAQFIDDLATSRAVVAGAGFTTMSECVYLRKPLLAIPLKGQFEQLLNARYLEREGYGMCAQTINPEILGAFLRKVDKYEDGLHRYSQNGNEIALKAIDEQIDRAAAGMYNSLTKRLRSFVP